MKHWTLNSQNNSKISISGKQINAQKELHYVDEFAKHVFKSLNLLVSKMSIYHSKPHPPPNQPDSPPLSKHPEVNHSLEPLMILDCTKW
mmetsp:Transcript_11801/g.17071  ORF Transcript_11801/g.17071 Transcript_11801/m.17071 type:complete len:89 (-) Transcript_11801:2462-2728(-)